MQLSHYRPGFTVLSMTEGSREGRLTPLLHLFLFISSYLSTNSHLALLFQFAAITLAAVAVFMYLPNLCEVLLQLILHSLRAVHCVMALTAEDPIVTTFLHKIGLLSALNSQ